MLVETRRHLSLFQGGLTVYDGYLQSIYKLDGMTGQPNPSYAPANHSLGLPAMHTDGTVFVSDGSFDPTTGATTGMWVTGLDPSTGQPKFRISIPLSTYNYNVTGQLCKNTTSAPQYSALPTDPIIAGDGFAYVVYWVGHTQVDGQDAVQPLPVGAYPLFDQLGKDFLPPPNPGAVIADAQALVQFLTSAQGPSGSKYQTYINRLNTLIYREQQGDTTGADGYYIALAPAFKILCDENVSGSAEIHLLKIGSDGSSADTLVHQTQGTNSITYGRDPNNPRSYTQTISQTPTAVYTSEDWNRGLITNADQGVLMSWEEDAGGYCSVGTDQGCTSYVSQQPPTYHVTSFPGGDAILPAIGSNPLGPVHPVLQMEDGSFVGTIYEDLLANADMIRFDGSGNVQGLAPSYIPQIATADGGIVGVPYAADNFSGDLIPGPAATFDANLNAAGQVDVQTQSWPGNSYTSSGSNVDRTLISQLEPALSFGAFQFGNPSIPSSSSGNVSGGTPTAIRLHRARVFIPYGLFRDATCNGSLSGCAPPRKDIRDSQWKTAALTAIRAPQSVMDIHLYNEASFGEYLLRATAPDWSVIKRTNEIVAYLGHGVVQPDASKFHFTPQYGDPSIAMGMLFPNTQCLWFNNLKPPQLPTSPPTSWDLFCDKGPNAVDAVVQKPRIIFIAICGVTDQFVQDWTLDSQKQALIVPEYGTANTTRVVDTNLTANEYLAFLYDLVQGNTVQHAVAYANTITQQDIAGNPSLPTWERWTWKAYGNTSLTFNTPSH